MAEQDWLSERFAEHQGRLRALAYRMLGSSGEAEDAVQDAWLRVSRADVEQVDNFGGWLTTVVARVCLNMLETRRSRPEDSAGIQPPEQSARGGHGAGPEDEMLLADSVGAALMVVLGTLAPAERLAFVLHDVFDVPFDQIAMIIDRTPAAARQIASRARRRVIAAGVEPEPDLPRRQKIVAAFLAASRSGDFGALLELLAPEAILRFYPTAQEISIPSDIRGADEVAGFFLARGAQAARLALVDGIPAAVWAPAGRPRAVFAFAISGDKITSIGLVADPDQLQDLDIVFLSSRGAPVRKAPAATDR